MCTSNPIVDLFGPANQPPHRRHVDRRPRLRPLSHNFSKSCPNVQFSESVGNFDTNFYAGTRRAPALRISTTMPTMVYATSRAKGISNTTITAQTSPAHSDWRNCAATQKNNSRRTASVTPVAYESMGHPPCHVTAPAERRPAIFVPTRSLAACPIITADQMTLALDC